MPSQTDWYQQALTPPEVVEVRARLGAVAETDHLQAMVEVLDPMTGVLIGQWSMPHATMRDLPDVMAWLTAKMLQAVQDSIEPF